MNSSHTDESQKLGDNDTSADVEMKVAAKKDGSDSVPAISKKKKKKKKQLVESSPTSPVHKKPKKDPNKPEYPKVGMYCAPGGTHEQNF